MPRDETAIVGGGNSAGQAAVYLAETAENVYVIVRSEGLVASMSQYLIRRIETTPNIELVTGPRSSSSGESSLRAIRWRNSKMNDDEVRDDALPSLTHRYKPIRRYYRLIDARHFALIVLSTSTS